MAFPAGNEPPFPTHEMRGPAFVALNMLERMLHEPEVIEKFPAVVAVDLRTIASMRTAFATRPNDRETLKLLRQVVIAWSTRLMGWAPHRFRVLGSLLDACGATPPS